MKKQNLSIYHLVIFSLLSLLVTNCKDSKHISDSNFSIRVIENENGNWGIGVDRENGVSFENLKPIEVELFIDHKRKPEAFGYDEVEETSEGFVGKASLRMLNGVILKVNDRWLTDKEFLHLKRTVKVSGKEGEPGGFMTGVTLKSIRKFDRSEIGVFAPGTIYYGTDCVLDDAIGGSQVYESGRGEVWIREDRLPAPLHGVHFPDGSSMAVLNPLPDGATSVEDAHSTEVKPLIDKAFQFGSIGSKIHDGLVKIGYWFPGSEGEITYKGLTTGRLHEWRLRYHPFENGFTQEYKVDFRFGQNESFPEFYSKAWRWAWQKLDPEVEHQNLELVRRSLIDMLADQVITINGRTGIPTWKHIVTGELGPEDYIAAMGFGGRNLESAYYLLQEGLIDSGVRGDSLRNLGIRIINSFVEMKMVPPAAKGFYIKNGNPTENQHVWLRSLGDGFNSMMRIIIMEDENGIEHPEWLAWAQSFGNWLLTQQYSDGGFPRSWRPKTGEIAGASPNSSYNPIQFLVRLSKYTGEKKYLDAALKAGEFIWTQTQGEGKYFIGGTIDNPDVIDAEAGALSLDAYLALYEETGEQKWLDRAKQAGDFVESWIYIWNVPMIENPGNDKLHWEKGVPTTGLQLVCTGHSLVFEYMAFEVDEFAKLYRYTGDDHYREVAEILLHNTKSMIALPGRLYGLKGPGWQTEHWTLAPKRGYGMTRVWWPWVTVSQLNGIFDLMDFDRELFEELAN